jgi:hypothetical protein
LEGNRKSRILRKGLWSSLKIIKRKRSREKIRNRREMEKKGRDSIENNLEFIHRNIISI